MSKSYTALPVITLDAEAKFPTAAAVPSILHLEDPAIDALQNFEVTPPFCVNKNTPIPIAGDEMKICQVHELIVLDDERHMIGLITAEDVLGEKAIKVAQEKRIQRAEVPVRYVMTPRENLVVLNYSDLAIARVGHIIATLHAHKKHHALVIKLLPDNPQQIVCGLFSLSLMSRRLGTDVTSDLSEATSLVGLLKKD